MTFSAPTPTHDAQAPSTTRQIFGRASTMVTPWERGLLVLLAIVLAYFFIANPFFGGQVLSLTEQFVATGIMAIGFVPVILTGGIDLSVGPTASLTGAVMGSLWVGGTNIWLACVIALLIAFAVGLVNGLIVVYAHIQSLVATLATMFILMSISTAVAGPNPPFGFPAAFTFLGVGQFGPVPVQLVVFIVIAIVAVLISTQTVFGRSLLMIGLSPDAARYSGIRVNWHLIRAYIVCSLASGVAGLFLAAYYSATRRDLGDSLLLPALTMVVLGGVDIFGGRGRVFGVVIAVFVLGLLSRGLLSLGISQLTANMIGALVLLLVIGLRGTVSGRALWRKIRGGIKPSRAPDGVDVSEVTQ